VPPDPPLPPDQQRDDQVGYAKPPHGTRFRKGQSGNPRGRAPGAKSLKRVLADALNELVIVNENGRRRKISKRQVFIKQLVNQAAKGDWRAAKLLLDMHMHGDIEGQSEPASPESSSFSEADEKVIAQLKVRLHGKKRESDD
jgi:hypothetical protein